MTVSDVSMSPASTRPQTSEAHAPARVLIVEDDARLAALLGEYLTGRGFDVSRVGDGLTAMDLITRQSPDVVVLDLMLPGANGFDVCRRVRERYDGAILMLTASKTESDHVTGLDLGADDFVTKPIAPRILLARIQSLVRRVARDRAGGGRAAPLPKSRVSVGGMSIDRELRHVSVADQPVELTGSEFGILWMLAENAGYPVTREALHTTALGTRWSPLDRGLDAHVSRIRRKLEQAGLGSGAIQSVRGEGYRLVPR